MTTSLKYPGDAPGKCVSYITENHAVLENRVICFEWKFEAGCIAGLIVENKHSGQILESVSLPQLLLGQGTKIDLSVLKPSQPVTLENNSILAVFNEAVSGLEIEWSAQLADESNAVIQTFQVTASRDTEIKELVFINSSLPDARQVGEVDGSVVVSGDIFMGIENPLAKNQVDEWQNVSCKLNLGTTLTAGQTRSYSAVFGVVPPNQLRRGFLYYIENRRIHPYRHFLHYNNWYDVFLGRPTERMTEDEAMTAIEYFGRELVEKRGVKFDAVVWDDGWDDFNTLWGFHKGFSDGFRNLMGAAEKYGIDQGVWMSPNGGYATAKEKRIAYGEPLGYETNENGYAMGGENYRKAFYDVCLKMIRNNGVVFFKFDGMGEGGSGKGHTTGTSGELSDDIHAILELSRGLHREKADVYVSATAGTWASPFWLLFADSVWRQGGDSGHHGEGDTRQQWITYRDMFCYERVVQTGPLYPINSLMLHGILIGDRPNRAPAGMVLDEKSVADEIWSFFASGTCLQELYVSPEVPSDTMLDELARGANWARANEDILVDTHWIGGNPAKNEVYGRASWQQGKGIISLRNPSENSKKFKISPEEAFELTSDDKFCMMLNAVYPKGRDLPAEKVDRSETIEWTLQPFETIVVEFESKI